jgi:hypothetical protein
MLQKMSSIKNSGTSCDGLDQMEACGRKNQRKKNFETEPDCGSKRRAEHTRKRNADSISTVKGRVGSSSFAALLVTCLGKLETIVLTGATPDAISVGDGVVNLANRFRAKGFVKPPNAPETMNNPKMSPKAGSPLLSRPSVEKLFLEENFDRFKRKAAHKNKKVCKAPSVNA